MRTTSKAIIDSGPPRPVHTAARLITGTGAEPGQASTSTQDSRIAVVPPTAIHTRWAENREITGPSSTAPAIDAATVRLSTRWEVASG
ncbi:hypothetical protein A5N15_01655 [Rothia kristinae]|uniref:Uncharacterized protein n=1 Tax=Rothia kristinae TaxID=37923 RepID=A0A657IW93_9MICC|nr:hypothetical protein A5N15_01655 [Rothia kristinae]